MTADTLSPLSTLLDALGVEAENPGAFDGDWIHTHGERVESLNPATAEPLAAVRLATAADYERVAAASVRAFHEWRTWPAPQRGEVVRRLGDELRRHKEDLGRLVSLEVGKVVSEGRGEVQEMIDMADLAVGLSRQLYGLAMHSERPSHRMYEQWHPLGPVGVITAFNFPVAVWAWNAMVAAVCGDSTIWKPSHQAPLTAIAVTRLAQRVLAESGAPPIFNLVMGGRTGVGERLVADPRVPLISATGSGRMGREVGKVVADRFGRSLLELGGNNGILVMDDADLDLALRAVLFAAVGTAGQRCTTTRRLLLQRGIAAEMKRRLVEAYGSVAIGDPLEPGTLMGPLIDRTAVDNMMAALERVKAEGGRILYGGRRLDRPGCFVEPTLVEVQKPLPITCEETFAPILYVFEFGDLDEAIRIHNDVPQGLSSAIFTLNMRSAERFLSAAGSDCGIANVNIGTSGAEIGGAFGGEKETGGGREAGSDSWKAYMRRQTCTINWGTELPLAQGVEFKVGA
ncbi:MAG TPA: aldehyde dehydrogenase family protein [Thermoanaerobaculia bacterium]|jgi:aldehyde dehydrogenase (NAD+)|nr:aldehyde dehydrogenase family protein [Thermoanaerobaculia bacterium]